MKLVRNLAVELCLPAGQYAGLFVKEDLATATRTPSNLYAVAWGYGYKSMLWDEDWKAVNTTDAGVEWFSTLDKAEAFIAQRTSHRSHPSPHSNGTEREKIIAGIRKLLGLSLGDGTTSEDADTARLMAKKLMAMYCVSMDEIFGR
jgi:hypothetical protein